MLCCVVCPSFINIGSLSLASINQTQYDPATRKVSCCQNTSKMPLTAAGLDLGPDDMKPGVSTKAQVIRPVNCQTYSWSTDHNNAMARPGKTFRIY